jgi:hypothetical protein
MIIECGKVSVETRLKVVGLPFDGQFINGQKARNA